MTKEVGGERNNEIVALCLAVVYSLFPGIQYAVFFDFHPVIIGVGLLPWIGYFWNQTGRSYCGVQSFSFS